MKDYIWKEEDVNEQRRRRGDKIKENKTIKCKKKVRKRGETRANLTVFHCVSLYKSSSRGSRKRNEEKRREVKRGGGREEKRRGGK